MIVAAVGLAGCGDGATAPEAQSGLRVVRTPVTTDTIYAAPTQALVIEVRDRVGRPVVGADMVFEAQPPADTTRGAVPGMSVCDIFARACVVQQDPLANPSPSAVSRTDAQGLARVQVQFGAQAGPAVVHIFNTALGLRDSVRFTVTPGAAARIRFRSRDTTVMIGNSVPVNADVVDRMGNVTTTPLTLRLSGNGTAITYDTVARRATGVAFGSARVVASSGGRTDSLVVHVVQKARLVVWSQGETTVRLVNSDGTEPSDVLSNMDSSNGVFPRFSPSRARVIGIESGRGLTTMTVGAADTNSNGRTQLPAAAGLFQVFTARLMADGSTWAGGTKTGELGVAIWRVDVNGSVSRVADLDGASGFGYGFIDIADDGSRVVYVSTFLVPFVNNGLRVIDVATKASRVIASEARTPRLSPDAQRVAFLVPTTELGVTRNQLNVVRADGTGRRVVSALNFGDGLTWSPDGEYLIGSIIDEDGGPGLRMVRVSDGTSVPMLFRSRTGALFRYLQPDWR